MPKHKNTKPETINELLEEVITAENIVEEEINNISYEKPEKVELQNDNSNLEKER